MNTEELAAIKARVEAATPGAWHWAGNIDTGEPYLATWLPGIGRCQILEVGYDERSTSGRAADQVRSDAIEYELGDPEELVRQWAEDQFGEPFKEPRLRFAEDLMMVNGRDRAVFEVARNATSREDAAVYRADIIGIRHPDAEFIAHARQDVSALLVDLEAAEAKLATVEATVIDAVAYITECRRVRNVDLDDLEHVYTMLNDLGLSPKAVQS